MSFETDTYTWISGLTDLGIIAAGWIFGLILGKLTLRTLLHLTRKTETEADDVVIEHFAKAVPWFTACLAALIAVRVGPRVTAMVPMVDLTIRVAFILIVTFTLASLLSSLLEKRVLPLGSVGATTLTRKLIFWVVVVAGFVVVLTQLGVEVGPVVAALGVGSLAVGLALQPTLTNVFAGFNLSLARRVRVGDFVRLESGQEGEVLDIGWRATEIRAVGDSIILVPNAKLSELILTNYSLPVPELACPVELTVAFGSDLDRVERVLLEIAREVIKTVPGGVPGFEPVVRFRGFGESSLPVVCVLRAKTFADRPVLVDTFVRRVHARFEEEGIEIPFPQRVVRHVGTPGPGTAPGAPFSEG